MPPIIKELKEKHENLHLIDMDVTDYDAFPSVVQQVCYLTRYLPTYLKSV